jgi:hypothetical protein
LELELSAESVVLSSEIERMGKKLPNLGKGKGYYPRVKSDPFQRGTYNQPVTILARRLPYYIRVNKQKKIIG